MFFIKELESEVSTTPFQAITSIIFINNLAAITYIIGRKKPNKASINGFSDTYEQCTMSGDLYGQKACEITVPCL